MEPFFGECLCHRSIWTRLAFLERSRGWRSRKFLSKLPPSLHSGSNYLPTWIFSSSFLAQYFFSTMRHHVKATQLQV